MVVAYDLAKSYGARAAVDGLTFELAHGEVGGLLGLNGAGKTTTLRLLSGLIWPSRGSVKIDGIDMARAPAAARARVGLLPEAPPLYLDMAVADYLHFAARLRGMRHSVAAAVEEALAVTDLGAVRHVPIATLSHGYRRRVGIAQAVVHRPALVLLDEPTAGLDPVQIVHMRALIRSLRGEHTVLVSSHLLSEVHQLCDRLFVLHAGRMVATGNEAELARRASAGMEVEVHVQAPAAELRAALTGWPEALAVDIVEVQGGRTKARVRLAGDARAALASRLVLADLGLLRLARVRRDLEDIFLRLAQGDRDEAA